jgi:hypothetical protein
MINFLRRIRRDLLHENKTSIYLIYAVGEVVLVVFGILIALQIDNWNELKKDRSEEIEILNSFHEEFLENKERMKTVESLFSEISQSNQLLMNLIGKKPTELELVNTDSLLGVSIFYYDYIPGDYVLSNLKSTGKLNLISSEKLRKLLFEWTQELSLKENAFEMLDKYFMESLIPYLNKNASLKNIDVYTSYGSNTPSVLESNSINMFQQIEFENHLDNYHWTVSFYIESLNKIDNLIDQIINETESIETVKG